jgi:hypothetical protein
MKDLVILRFQIERGGLKLSASSLTRIQSVSDTLLYTHDLMAQPPEPLLRVAEIDAALSCTKSSEKEWQTSQGP